jgi:hypothetical protein
VFTVRYQHHLHIRSEAIPVAGHRGLQGCEIFRIPHCLDNRLTDDGEVIGLTRRPCSSPLRLFFRFCHSFLLEAEPVIGLI